MTPDPTLLARLLLSGAAVEFPAVTATHLRPMWGGYAVEIECDEEDVRFMQWCAPEELDEVVSWLVTCVWALNGKKIPNAC